MLQELEGLTLGPVVAGIQRAEESREPFDKLLLLAEVAHNLQLRIREDRNASDNKKIRKTPIGSEEVTTAVIELTTSAPKTKKMKILGQSEGISLRTAVNTLQSLEIPSATFELPGMNEEAVAVKDVASSTTMPSTEVEGKAASTLKDEKSAGTTSQQLKPRAKRGRKKKKKRNPPLEASKKATLGSNAGTSVVNLDSQSGKVLEIGKRANSVRVQEKNRAEEPLPSGKKAKRAGKGAVAVLSQEGNPTKGNDEEQVVSAAEESIRSKAAESRGGSDPNREPKPQGVAPPASPEAHSAPAGGKAVVGDSELEKLLQMQARAERLNRRVTRQSLQSAVQVDFGSSAGEVSPEEGRRTVEEPKGGQRKAPNPKLANHKDLLRRGRGRGGREKTRGRGRGRPGKQPVKALEPGKLPETEAEAVAQEEEEAEAEADPEAEEGAGAEVPVAVAENALEVLVAEEEDLGGRGRGEGAPVGVRTGRDEEEQAEAGLEGSSRRLRNVNVQYGVQGPRLTLRQLEGLFSAEADPSVGASMKSKMTGERNVQSWLESLGLGKYHDVLDRNEVDNAVLPHLTMEDLKEMGITAVGARRKLYMAILELQRGNPQGSAEG